jgi:inhibitor of KinA sporulation pathway (predicted exonuclease)
MKYIILDLEASCWEPKDPSKKNEIIEIGALCINENKTIESEFCAFVKPKLDTQLSPFCIKLTTISQEQVDAAETFPEVLQKFKNWIGTEEYLLCSWGHYDRVQLKNDCELHGLETSWLEKHISLKHQYTGIKGLKKHIGMAGALWMEKIELEGTHHRGIDDARNIAKIFLQYFGKWDTSRK